jgi:hypothetical protein
MNTELEQIARAITGISVADLTTAERIIYKILKKRNIVTERMGDVELVEDQELNNYIDQQEDYSKSQELPEDYPF